ncbi:hypothetical protein MUN82_14350 [Hymenobacter aerilatus]|uniref:Uncharacterized protein n=1 Tax=Hymenobacter aerilatus TaxID=2932251 RepID=A0A8T9SRZ5_9BACT|nr:hypothetical protein [Hymenobacter aerilatus]UOR04121.1 hypothetical protein MUN82_14350 [Hymenobacter aerilatus]
MHNLFSFQRFGRLFRKHTAEHLREYLMGAAVLFGGILVLMLALSLLQGGSMNADVQTIFFVVFLLGAGTFFTSTIFQQFGSKNRAIAAFCLPASTLEKYLVGWLYSFVLFVLVYVPVFYLANGIVLLLFNTQENYHEAVGLFSAEHRPYSAFYIYAALHAVTLVGAIAFEKAHFVKTAFVFFGMLGVLTVLNFQVLKTVFGQELALSFPFNDLRFSTPHSFYTVGLPDNQTQWVGLVFAVLTGLFWAAAYARLREKQV